MIKAQPILERLVAVPSLSGQEAAAADALTDILTEGGLSVNRHDENVWCEVGDGPNTLLLNSHLDVVPPSEGHPYDPFQPTVNEGRLYGRGAVDAKGSVSAMVAALIQLRQEGWTPEGGRVVGAFTACEERGWPYNGLEATRPQLPAVNAAIVGEPTNLSPCIAQKGLLILRIDAEGKSAHAARPHLGVNAIAKAAADVTRLGELVLDRVHPVLGPITVTPTVIEGGTTRNTVPDRCSVFVDIRSTPVYTHLELTEIVRQWLTSPVAIHSERLIPVDTAPDERIVQAAIGASGANPVGSPTTSDWIFLSDVPTVKMGPGSSNLSHTADEHIELDDLERAVGVYRQTILNYFERA